MFFVCRSNASMLFKGHSTEPRSEAACTGGAIERHLRQVAALVAEVQAQAVEEVARVLAQARAGGRMVFTLGNGGSAATADHLAADLSRVASPQAAGAPLNALSLASNVSLLSGLGNDLGYEAVFVKQLEGRLRARDVVIGISVSGDSENCVRALSYARATGATTVGLLGASGGRLLGLCDLSVHVACHEYGAVEDAHMVIGHALVLALGAAPAQRGRADAAWGA